MIKLREYQELSFEKLRANIRDGIRNQILCLPTGGGKTVIAAYMLRECHQKGKRAVFVADRIALIDQTSATLDKYGIPHGVIQASHWRARPWEQIQIASAQTLARRKWPDADLIIVDEAHGLNASVLKRIHERNTVVVGLTATPFTRGLGKYYDSVVTVTTTNQLIGEGHLVGFKVFAASEPDMTGAKTTAGEWTDSEAEKRSMPIVGDCVAEYLRHGQGKKFIAFGCTIAHCVELQRQFMSAGVMCELYTSKTGDEQRTQIVEEFRKDDSYIRGLISVAALAKGFDVPDVGVIIMARPLRSSLAEHIQILGRGLRPHHSKDLCIILDHSGNMVRFWDDMHDFMAEGISELDDGKPKPKKEKKEKKKEPKKCPKCFHVHSPGPRCPACGYEYPVRNNVVHEAGSLVELNSGKGGSTTATKQDFYSQLLFVATDRGYSPGWIAHKYKAKFGVWPRNMANDPKPPSSETMNWIRSQVIAFAKRKVA